MSAIRATYSMEAMTPCQDPASPCIQNPSPSMYPSHPLTYDMPAPPVYPAPNSVMKRQNYYFSGQYGLWPYQPWGESVMPSMSLTYQSAPYLFYNPECLPTAYHMTHPEMPQYIPTPYLMTHPQSMPQVPRYFSPFHHTTHLHNVPQTPHYSPPYPHHVTRPQTITQRPQHFLSTPYCMTRPQTIPKTKASSTESFSTSKIKDRKYGSEGKRFMFESKTSQCIESSSGEASESDSSEDKNFENENNNSSQELNKENSNENISDEACKSNSVKDAKIEVKNKKIPQEMKDTKRPNELNKKNCTLENHGTTSESPSKSDWTENKTSRKKKKKKQKNKSDVNNEGSLISKEASPVSDISQNMKNKQEHLRLEDEKSFLAQFRAVITEVHCTMGKLQTQNGTEYYFPPAMCFLYGVSLAHLELWHVLIEGQQVKVTLDLTIPEMARVTRVTVEEENPDNDLDATVLDLQKWCSINCVPEKATITLIQQVRDLH